MLRKMLRKLGVKVSRIPRGSVAGVDLPEDLRLLIGTDTPTCLDVGANRGQTIDLLRTIFSNPVIHAFEPARAMYLHLQQKYRDERIQLYSCALGSAPSRQPFLNYTDSCLSSLLHLDRDPRNRFRDTPLRGTEHVDVDTIDSFLERHGIVAVDLLKVDTQGYDLEVLKGASDALSRGTIRNLLVELNLAPMYEGQCKAAEVIAYLDSKGYGLVDFYEKFRQALSLAWCTALFTRIQKSESI